MQTSIASSSTPKLLLAASVALFLFYFFGLVVLTNVYRYAVVGAVYEALSVPMLLLLVAVPVLAIIRLVKHRGMGVAYAVAALVFVAATVGLFVWA